LSSKKKAAKKKATKASSKKTAAGYRYEPDPRDPKKRSSGSRAGKTAAKKTAGSQGELQIEIELDDDEGAGMSEQKVFTIDDTDEIETILETGRSYRSPSTVVFLLEQSEPFTVEDDEAGMRMFGEAGDLVGYDQELRRLVLVKASELDRYEEVSTGSDGHPHVWGPGVLPGDRYVRVCQVADCGAIETIDREAWDQLKLRSAPAKSAAPGRN
jgi:hypothetical protein